MKVEPFILNENVALEYPGIISGSHLPAQTLGGIVQSEKLLILHFLRHLGCLLCKESVSKLHKLKQQKPTFPTVYFIHQSSVEDGDVFFDEYFPGSPHISDMKLELYRYFAINRMEGLQLLNPKMYARIIQAMFGGFFQTEIKGDPQVLTGTFLFYNGKLAWQHHASYAGEEPKWEKITML